MKATHSSMHTMMQTWLRQASDASGFLRRLYVELKDPSQRDRAIAAGAFARERCRGMRPIASGKAPRWLGKASTEAEHIAWVAVIESLLGLNILVAIGGHEDGSYRGTPLHHRLNKELKTALQGFTSAFPRDTVEEDLDRICSIVIQEAAEVAEQAWSEVRQPGEQQADVRNFLREEWTRDIKPGLMSMIE